jgi:putative CocE/NonD family hydrolase
LKVVPNRPHELPLDDLLMEFDLPVRARDGAKLSTDVYRPRGPEKQPVILIRTPYNNNSDDSVRFGKTFASWGYAVVIQDVRGRNDSEGEFEPFTNEGPDGLDTVKWLREQDWFSGRIGMTGGSYLAQVQWDLAMRQPAELKAMVSMVSPSDMFINCWYRNGTLTWGDLLRWMTQTDAHVGQNLLAYNMPKLRMHAPLKSIDKELGRDIWWWNKMIEHQTNDSFWKARSVHDSYHKIDVPVLNITGWYDDCADGSFQHYLRMKSSGRTPAARKNQGLIVGPWPHGINVTSRYGGIDFGQGALIDLYDVQRRWMDYWLKDIENGVMKEKPVTVFVMGQNKWREEATWPLKRAKPTRVFLRSQGRANGLQGDGRLSLRPPSAKKESGGDHFDYDPEDPNPSPVNVNEPDDRRSAERRDDALNYDSPTLTKTVEVTGQVMLELFVSSSARDTDFVGRLVDVYPNGYAHPVADGIITCRFRESLERPSLMKPGEVYKLALDLWWTSNSFQKGHKIRVEVTSSDFPRYARNMNTGRPYGEDKRGVVAHQTVLHDAKHPSCVVLPFVGTVHL